MTQSNFKIVGYTQADVLIMRPLFQQGMRDFHAGVWDQAAADKSSTYERGRQFAAATGARRVMITKRGRPHGRHVNLLKRLGQEKAII